MSVFTFEVYVTQLAVMQVEVARTITKLLSLGLCYDHVDDTTCCILNVVSHHTAFFNVPHFETLGGCSK